MYKKVEAAAEYLKSKIGTVPEIAIVLGSGLGKYAQTLENSISIPYKEIPGMPATTVVGHQGAFVCGKKQGKNVLLMQGRAHYYEGNTLDQVIFPIRVLKLLGIKTLILTNAAGAVNTSYHHGEFMLISDHINLTGNNCLIGQSALDFGPRFPSMTCIYDKELRKLAKAAAEELDIAMHEGVYYYCTGPSFETPAEIRAIRILGGDAVGMSTVHEAVAAVQMDIIVLGISCLTNMAAGILDQPLTHEEVMETGNKVAAKFAKLIDNIIKNL